MFGRREILTHCGFRILLEASEIVTALFVTTHPASYPMGIRVSDPWG
jgi:hypothetical protein